VKAPAVREEQGKKVDHEKKEKPAENQGKTRMIIMTFKPVIKPVV